MPPEKLEHKTMLFASSNAGKLKEVRQIASRYGLLLCSPEDLSARGARGPLPEEPEESGDTYLGNAQIKAQCYFDWCTEPTLADDTGLEVDFLKGAPGLYSARYAGPEKNSRKNIEKLLDELRGQRNRTARFRCALFLKLDAWNSLSAEAVLEGSIATEPRGTGGFGYDSVFMVGQGDLTLAELKESGSDVKTHRVLALEKLFGALLEE